MSIGTLLSRLFGRKLSIVSEAEKAEFATDLSAHAEPTSPFVHDGQHRHNITADSFNEAMDELAERLGGKWLNARIAGVSYPNDDGSSRQEFVSRLKPNDQLYCVPTPNNPHDRNAVAIYDSAYHQLGHVPAKIAWELSRAMARGYSAGCVVQSVGNDVYGVWGASIGVIWYPDPTKAPKE